MTHKRVNIDTLTASSGVRFGTSGERGLVTSMHGELCYAYSMAILREVVGKGGGIGGLVLGHDSRSSSPQIPSACAAAIRRAGGKLSMLVHYPHRLLPSMRNNTKQPLLSTLEAIIPSIATVLSFIVWRVRLLRRMNWLSSWLSSMCQSS